MKKLIDIKYISEPPKLYWFLRWIFPDYDFKKGVACAFGDRVYIYGGKMEESFQVHEATHLYRQKYSRVYAVWWWIKYILSKDFRYREELIAYQNQWDYIKVRCPIRQQWLVLDKLAAQLASPLYGKVVTKEEALASIIRKHMQNKKKPVAKKTTKKATKKSSK